MKYCSDLNTGVEVSVTQWGDIAHFEEFLEIVIECGDIAAECSGIG